MKSDSLSQFAHCSKMLLTGEGGGVLSVVFIGRDFPGNATGTDICIMFNMLVFRKIGDSALTHAMVRRLNQLNSINLFSIKGRMPPF